MPYLIGLIAVGVGLFALSRVFPALAATNVESKPKIPIPPELAFPPGVTLETAQKAGWLPPGSYAGKRAGQLPKDVKAALRLALQRVFNFVNPADARSITPEQMEALKIVLPVPSGAINSPKGFIYVRRPAKERLQTARDVDPFWDVDDQMIVLAPIVVQPKYGPLGIKIPKWVTDVIATGVSFVPGAGPIASTGIRAVSGTEKTEEPETLEHV